MPHGLNLAWNTVSRMVDGFFSILPNLLIAAFLYLAIYFLGGVFARIVTSVARNSRMDFTLAHALGKLTAVGTNVIGLLICAVIVVPNFSPDKLIAGLGITSVAIGFAFQNILQNFFAGMLLLWQKPFRIGDEIKAKDFEGSVEDITIRTTILRTYGGEKVFIPNGVLFTEPVIVKTAYGRRQIHLQLPLQKEADPSHSVEIAKNTLAQLPCISKDPAPEVYITASGANPTLDVYAWAGAKNNQIIKATDEATFHINRALSQNDKAA